MKAFRYLNKSGNKNKIKGMRQNTVVFKLRITLELFLEVKDSAHCSTT